MSTHSKKYKHLGDDLSSPAKVARIERRTTYDTSSPHRHNYIELFFFQKGGGTHMIDLHEYEVADFSVHSVVANKVHHLKRANTSFGFILLLKTDFVLHEILKSNATFLILHEKIDLNKEQFEVILDLVLKIEQELRSSNPDKHEMVVAYVYLMLLKLKEFTKNDQPGLENNLYLSFYFLLEEYFRQERSPQFYADQLNISSRQLGEVMNRVTGKSTTTLIQERLFLESKRLLFHSTWSMKEIALELDFADVTHFSHFFKKYSGISPTEYKKRENDTNLP